MNSRAAAICALAVLLGGCMTTPPVHEAPKSPHRVVRVPSPAAAPAPLAPSLPAQDGPPRHEEIPPEIEKIPDAIPQAEEKSRYGNPDSYEVYGKRYQILRDTRGFHERGYASWYGKKFHGQRTSSGAPYDMFAMTAAHKTLPIPAYARVTNVANGKSVVVKINDRGPFHEGRIVDLSYAAALKLGMLGSGSTLVDLEVVAPDVATRAKVTASTEPLATAKVSASPPVPNPPVVAVSPGAPRAETSTTEPPRYLQAGVFNDAVNAVAFRDWLAADGVQPLLMKSETRNERWVYRVLIGPFANVAELDATRMRLKASDKPTVPVLD